MKIKAKILVSFLLIYLVTISITSSLYYSAAKKALKKQIFNNLESVVVKQHRRIESIIDQNLERLLLVTSRTQLRLSLRNYAKEKTRAELEKVNKILHDARSSIPAFEDILVTDLNGEIISSTKIAMTGKNASKEEFFSRGIKGNSVDIFFIDNSNDLKVYLAGPLYLAGQVLGVVAIKSNTEDLLEMITDYSGMGETGETILAKENRIGDALILTPLRFDQDAALKKTISSDNLSRPIIQALSGNETLLDTTIDYRGQNVLAATRHIEKMNWGIIAKIDTAEAFKPIFQLRYMLLFIVLASSAVIIAASLFLAGTITRPLKILTKFAAGISSGDLSQRVEIRSNDEIGALSRSFNKMISDLNTYSTKLEEQIEVQMKMRRQLEQELLERKQMEEQLLLVQTSVNNAGESIFLIDKNAKFVQTNKAASLSLGYSAEELLNMTVSDIDPGFPLERWDEHWREVRKKGSLSFESTHRHKNGRTFPVEVRVNHVKFGNKEYNFAFATDITERKNSEDKLIKSLKEKEVLLREIHHRTKNNMQIISSLLSLQSEKVEDAYYNEILLESQNRIKTMSLIHEKLYRSDDLANIDFKDYINSLVINMFRTYDINTKTISFKTDIDNIALSIDTAIPCGLIINELVSNSFKHAFPGDRKGEISIAFKQIPGDKYLLSVTDNGIGIPEEINISETKTLGLQLVTTLARHQLQGEIEIIRDKGSSFRICFKETTYSK